LFLFETIKKFDDLFPKLDDVAVVANDLFKLDSFIDLDVANVDTIGAFLLDKLATDDFDREIIDDDACLVDLFKIF